MNFPPCKRPRGSAPVLDLDPFDEDFTQDDLKEIDILASQAITTTTGGGVTTATGPGARFSSGRHNIDNHNSNMGTRPALGSDRGLDTQHAQLKRKLQEMEEDVVLKSGEIRVLRDSLRAAQHEAETHKLKQVQLQTQQQQEQSNREKDLLKKVQSLESQLQFKEAELNDMRSKLLSDRKSSPLCRNSPKLSSPLTGGFITKESFNAQVCTNKNTPGPASANKNTPGAGAANWTPVKTPLKSRRQEVTHADPFLSVRPPRTTHSGGVLLGLLLQPVSQGASLCHLLSLSPKSASLVDGSSDVISSTGSSLSPVQSLALTGLNKMSHNRHNSSCPGAVLLLPLLHSHLSQLCDVAQANGGVPACTSAAGRIPACSSAARGSGSVTQCTTAGSKMEDQNQNKFTVEECGLVALRTLTTLLTHSKEVVEEVLSEQTQNRTTDGAPVDSISQNALLPCVLRLCKVPHRPEITCTALTTLRALVERTPPGQDHRFQCVLSEVCSCLSAGVRIKVVSECVSVLTSITDYSSLTQHLCSQHDPCVLLRLLQFVRSRSDPEAAHSDWVQLDLKVVRLLSRLLNQSSVRSTNHNCPCYSELVQCVILVLHRLWLDSRSSLTPYPPLTPDPVRCGRGLAALRETVLLLHWLLQNHSSFTESVRGVLHLYDQVIPAVREALKTGYSYSEELALDEICRSEADDDMDTDSGS